MAPEPLLLMLMFTLHELKFIVGVLLFENRNKIEGAEKCPTDLLERGPPAGMSTLGIFSAM
jgi:hypothetical protein